LITLLKRIDAFLGLCWMEVEATMTLPVFK